MSPEDQVKLDAGLLGVLSERQTEALDRAVRKALAAERERCAVTAEEYGRGVGVVNDLEGRPLCAHCDGESVGFDIAARIREGGRT